MAKMDCGQTMLLNVTKEAQHRVVVGLSWDPAKPGFLDKMCDMAGVKPAHHDLDLLCFIYDAEKNLIDTVSADADHAIDRSETIYHSGDNIEGHGGGDDEEISVELKNVPDSVHSIVFVSFIKTGHKFKDVNIPEIHLADGYTGRDFLHIDLNDGDQSSCNGFIFCKIFRDTSKENSWALTNISNFCEIEKNAKISELVKPHL